MLLNRCMRFLILLVVCCLLTVFTNSSVHAQDAPTKDGRTSRQLFVGPRSSPFEPPEESDTIFIVDDASGLDTDCSFRSEGPLIFEIEIERYIGDFEKLKSQGLLPETVELKMPAFDVDVNGGDEEAQPERDRVSFNGNTVPNEYLTGDNDIWILNDFEIPIDWVNFPESDPGDGGTVNPGVNTIQIDIDTANIDEVWCTAIDWASLSIELPRPILFVHGTNSAPEIWDSLWIPRIEALGLPTDSIDVGKFDTFGQNARKIATRVERLQKRWGIEKLNIVSHSKGGTDSRHYAEDHDTVDLLIQLGTPNGGTPIADLGQAAAVTFLGAGIPILVDLEAPALAQQTVTYMSTLYNPWHGANPNTTYIALAGDYRFGGWGILDNTTATLFLGRNDLVVPVWSVHNLDFTRNFTFNSEGNNKQAQHTSLHNSNSIYNLLYSTLIKARSSRVVEQSSRMLVQSASAQSSKIKFTERIVGEVQTGQTVTHSLYIDNVSSVGFMLAYPQGEFGFSLVSPDGIHVDIDTASSNRDVEFQEFDSPDGLHYQVIAISDVDVDGEWTLEVSGVSLPEKTPYSLIGLLVDSPIDMSITTDKTFYTESDVITIEATIQENSAAISGATVSATVLHPDDSTSSLLLSDSGTGGDLVENDGVYTGQLENTTQAGVYRLVINASKDNGPAFSREEFLAVSVSASRSQINNTFSDYGSDLDGDSLYEELIIETEIDTSSQGRYRLFGILSDGDGRTIATSSQQISLTNGIQTVPIAFDGIQIFESVTDGPYSLSILRLAEDDLLLTIPVDEVVNAYSTSAYSYTQFQSTPIAVPGTGIDRGVDIGNDPAYDLLEIDLEVIVVDEALYTWSARLVDNQGGDLGIVTGSSLLESGRNTITLQFDGTIIAQNRIDGPYYLNDLLIYSESESLVVLQAYGTSPYLAEEFEGYVAPTADLSIAVEASEEIVMAGEPITQTLTISNQGPEIAKRVQITQTWSISVPQATARAQQGTCANSNNKVICAIGNIAPGNSVDIEVVVETTNLPLHTPFSSQLLVNTSSIDSIPENNVIAQKYYLNSLPGITITPTALNTLEGGESISYTVYLDSLPTAPVTISITSDNQLQIASDNKLVFNAERWNLPQVVSIEATDDLMIEGSHRSTVTHEIASDDVHYSGLQAIDIEVDITDDDNTSDPDADTLLTEEEDLNQDGDPTNDDSDSDGIPNYLDPDDDNDSIATQDEDVNKNGNLEDDDTDGDSRPNYLDPDDDGDTVETSIEGTGDEDGDGIPNYLDSTDEQPILIFVPVTL